MHGRRFLWQPEDAFCRLMFDNRHFIYHLDKFGKDLWVIQAIDSSNFLAILKTQLLKGLVFE